MLKTKSERFQNIAGGLFFPSSTSHLLSTFACLSECERTWWRDVEWMIIFRLPCPILPPPCEPAAATRQSLPEPVSVCSHGLFVLIMLGNKERAETVKGFTLITKPGKQAHFLLTSRLLLLLSLPSPPSCKIPNHFSQFPVVKWRAWQRFSAELVWRSADKAQK